MSELRLVIGGGQWANHRFLSSDVALMHERHPNGEERILLMESDGRDLTSLCNRYFGALNGYSERYPLCEECEKVAVGLGDLSLVQHIMDS